MADKSMIQYFVIHNNINYVFGLVPNKDKDIYDTVVLEFDEMMDNIVWEDIVHKEVDMAAIEPKEVTEADVEARIPAYGTDYTVMCSENWYPYDVGMDMYLSVEDVMDGYKLLFVCSVIETAATLDEGYANFEKLISTDFKIVESQKEIEIGGQKGYSIVTKQEMKYIDIYRQTYYTIVNGKEYAFTFQADAEDYAYLKLEKEAMFQSIVFE